MSDTSRAAALLRAMSSPCRLALLAAIADRQARGAETSAPVLAAGLKLSVKSVLKEAVRLQECGLLSFRGQTMSVNLSTFAEVADGLVAELPIARLLAEEPGLGRFFTNGRLTAFPEDAATRERIAHLLVQLLPTDHVMPEAEINQRLNEVHDDHATMRRLLVDTGLLTRNASSDYRRVRTGTALREHGEAS